MRTKVFRAALSRAGTHPTRLVLLAVVMATVAAGYVILDRAEASTPTTQEPGHGALAVTVASVAKRSWPRVIEADGPIAAWEEASIGTAIGGLRVDDVRVDVSDVVRRGQVLVRFDTRALRAEAQELSANLVQAEAQRVQAEADSARAEKLVATGSVSQQDALQARTQAQVARGQVAATAARLNAKNVQLGQSQIVAPDDGVISVRSVSVGAVTTVGQELLRLIRKQRLEWRGQLTAFQLGDVVAGQPVSITLPDGTDAKAVVKRISPAMNAQTRLATIYAELVPGSRARSGMYASARIELPSAPARTVPAMSVVLHDGRSVVAKVRERDGAIAVTLQRVTVGRRIGSEVEVLEGLSDSDRVVVQGAGLLGEGDLVRIVGQRSAPVAKRS